MLSTQDFIKELIKHNGNINKLRTNSLLPKDAWKAIDSTFLRANRARLVGVADIMQRNLFKDLGSNGFAVTVYEYETMSNPTGATLSMSGRVKGDNEKDEYQLKSLPMPIISKFWELDARTMASAKRSGIPIDTTKADDAGKCIAELKEDILFNGTDAFTYGGGTIYGYTDFPDRTAITMGGSWLGKTADEIVKQILDMKQAMLDNRRFGDAILYIPATYETLLDIDFNSTRGITLRERILKIGKIADIRVADSLGTDNTLLVEMTTQTVEMIIGQNPVTVSWDIDGGQATDFYSFEIAVPLLKADDEGNTGVVHCS